MKVETTVGERYEKIGGAQPWYGFVANVEIPFGAKVTVEWDENEHQCPKLAHRGLKVVREDSWYLASACEDWMDQLGPIDLCPCCGKVLDDRKCCNG